MDLNLSDTDSDASFRVRRIPTWDLIQTLVTQEDLRKHKKTLVELCTRFINPFMNLILTIVCVLILLKSSLLRRRASFAPVMAVVSMAGIMAAYMSVSNMVASITDFLLVAFGVFVLLIVLIGLLIKK